MQSAVVQRSFSVAHLSLVASLLASLTPAAAHAVCATPVTCICEEWPKAHVLHGTVRDTADDVSQVDVHEVLAGSGMDPVAPGDVIVGELAEPSTCGLSLSSFGPGDEVLALWEGTFPDPLECPELTDCTEARCDAWAAVPEMEQACRSECMGEVREACPAKTPRLVLVPWGAEIDLGDGRMLASESAAVLADRWQCNTMFAGPLPSCNDQILVAVDDSACSVGRLGSSASDRGLSLVVCFFVIAFVYLSVRRTRRVPR
jgi:hypothetical protein